jgi:hypothetical protein
MESLEKNLIEFMRSLMSGAMVAVEKFRNLRKKFEQSFERNEKNFGSLYQFHHKYE